jgi:two-component system response regulator HydG
VVRLPALRERREDLPQLLNHFLTELSAKYHKPLHGASDQVRRAFAHYDWPGNVRELRNLLESMALLDSDGTLGADDLPEDSGVAGHLHETAVTRQHPGGSGADSLIGRPLAEVERFYMEQALELTDGNREEAAKLLGIGERTLYRKIQEWKKDVVPTADAT